MIHGYNLMTWLQTFGDLSRGSGCVPATSVPWSRFLRDFTVPRPTVTQLQVINKAMAQFRLNARQAPVTPFHRFVERKMDQGECGTHVTQNFDGLETRDRQDLRSRVVRLYGDNTTLGCAAPKCMKLAGAHVAGFDARFLAGETIICPTCSEAGECLVD
jgi:NAD-dependent SIR2 family protein deacetylase